MRLELVNVWLSTKGPNRTLGGPLETVDLAQPASQWVPTGENLVHQPQQISSAPAESPQSIRYSPQGDASRPASSVNGRRSQCSGGQPTVLAEGCRYESRAALQLFAPQHIDGIYG
jgi:hypothetical protein